MRLFAALLLMLTIPVQAGTLTIAAEDAWPPFSDDQGMGFSRELATAAFQLAGISLTIQTVPYARALTMTQAGVTDACWNVTRQPSTERQFVFGEVPLFQAAASYYYKTGKEKNYRRPSDIPDGTRIAIINGYEYGAEFEEQKQRFHLTEVSKQKQMLSLLVNDRVDMAVFFDRVFDYSMVHSHFDRSLFSRGHINHISDIYIAFSRRNPAAADYARQLDNGLRALKESGEYDRIMENTAPVL